MYNAKECAPTSLLDDYLSWLDGLCSTYLSIQQAQCPGAFQGRGIVIPESQVALALSGQTSVAPQSGFLSRLRCLQEKMVQVKDPLAELFLRLHANDFQQLVLLLAIAPEMNRKYERVFAYLQDDAQERSATLGLAADLFGLVAPLDEKTLFSLCDRQHPLNRYILAQPAAERHGGAQALSRPLILRQPALMFLSKTRFLPDSLSLTCTVLSAHQQTTPLANETMCQQAAAFAEYFLKAEHPKTGLLQICGARHSGRRFTLQYMASQSGYDVLCIDCERLSALAHEEWKAALEAALSWCWLNQAIPALYRFDFAGSSGREQANLVVWMLQFFKNAVPFFALCVDHPLELPYDSDFSVLCLQIPPYTIREQQLFWQNFSKECVLPLAQDTMPSQLANIYSLAPGKIRFALSAAEMEEISRREQVIHTEAIAQGVRQLCSPKLLGLSEPLTPSFGWEDLMLDEATVSLLRKICDRIRYRWKVNEEWGFDRKLPYGKGVSVLLYGPPGTGKTMTAQVLAREFGLDAYRVDISRVMDKYIGETEKKLAELFDAAKDSNAILFFDEADALFSKRTDISDSKDKYANVETAYLLQRMEAHNGISILASNAVQNFDNAFKRRISFMVNIALPNVETRKQIWKSVFPDTAPLKNVNLDSFAERFELSGSSIKNVAVAAAFLAAADGSSITRYHLTQAVRDEYNKTGRVLMEHELF